MKTLSVLIMLAMVLLVASCGGTKSSPDEAGLRQRAEAAAEAASSANQKDHPFDIWKDVYRFLTPEYRKRCGPSSESGLQVDFNLIDLVGKAVFDGAVVLDGALLVEDGAVVGSNGNVLGNYVTPLDYQVTNVTVNSPKGQVELKVLHQGVPVALGGDHKPEYWLYDDGQWWLESSRYWMDDLERKGEECTWGRGWYFGPP